MNRQQRRAAARKTRRVGTAVKKRSVGKVIRTETVSVLLTTGERQLYWFERPEGFSPADKKHLHEWFCGLHEDGPRVGVYGPFQMDDEVSESQRIVLLGPGGEITEGGMWDPAWDKPQ
jgi:hypothetical protein